MLKHLAGWIYRTGETVDDNNNNNIDQFLVY